MWSTLIPSWLRTRRDRFLTSASSREPSVVALPGARRIYAIGDVHGRADLLARMHERIAEDLAASPASTLLVHLGDYIDRGDDTRGVLDILCQADWPTDEAIHLRGNHEDLLLRFLEDASLGRAWLELGGDTTLSSYGVSMTPRVPPAQRFETIARDLAGAMPAAHVDFLHGCADRYVEGSYLFVHAGIRPGRRLDRQESRDLMWIRDEFLRSSRDHGHLVVHGHNVTAEPDQQANRIGIDTGACWSGVLTCLVLEGESQRFMQVRDQRG